MERRRFAQSGGVGAGVGDFVFLAFEGQVAFALQDLPDDGDVFFCPRHRFAESHAMPALDHLRPGHAQSAKETTAGQMLQGHRGHRRHRRRARGNLHDPGADIQLCRVRQHPGGGGDGVGAVRLAGPGLRKAQSFGFLDALDVEFGMGARHIDGDAKSHGFLQLLRRPACRDTAAGQAPASSRRAINGSFMKSQAKMEMPAGMAPPA